MSNKTKGILQILVVIVVIALCAGVAYQGIGTAHRGSAKNIRLGLDLEGGVSITYESVKANPTSQELADTVYQLQKRVEDISTEAEVYSEGTNRITVDIPGAKDAEKVFKQLGKQGALEFRDESGKVIITGDAISTATAETRTDKTTGKTENAVSLKLNKKGTKLFATATAENINKTIGIYYDNKELSSPTVESEITNGEASISGGFATFDEADSLAKQIRIGALKLELKDIQRSVVGAKLGEDALNTSLIAGLIGLLLVIIFMIIMYRIPGVAASIALIFYVAVELLILNVLDVTLTLPGIAGIVLSIGMAVDANVIIFTRIKEELATGKTVASAIKLGFSKALSAIIDGNVTTLIAAVVLWFFGSGTVKGFAQTLAIGVVLSMFTALFVTKFILIAFNALGCDDVKYFGIQKERKVINFIGNYKKYLMISGALFLLCIGGIVFNQVNTGSPFKLSLDFQGGSSTNVTLPSETNINDSSEKTKMADLVKKATNATTEISTVASEHQMVIRTKALTIAQQNELSSALENEYKIKAEAVQTENISATVSDEMKSDAIVAVLIATVCMLLYIWIRFRNIAFGLSSVLALVHDCIVVLMVYAIFSHFITVGSTFIACMLTIVGYSINATIVVFDRIRENRKKKSSRTALADVVNMSVTQTLSRSINTSITTFIMVFILAILGVDSVRQFAIPLIVGIICGCYSSVCIAGSLWYMFNRKRDK